MPRSIIFEVLGDLELPPSYAEVRIITWLERVAFEEEKQIRKIMYILCSDSHLLDLNRQYLQHDTLTDIITFPYATDPIEAEIYISLDRVRENAKTYSGGDYDAEFHRVVVHGLLHMCGYGDHNEEEREVMRTLESYYLQKLKA